MIYQVEYRKVFIDKQAELVSVGQWMPDKVYKSAYFAMRLCFLNAINNTERNEFTGEYEIMQSRIVIKEG